MSGFLPVICQLTAGPTSVLGIPYTRLYIDGFLDMMIVPCPPVSEQDRFVVHL